MADRKITLDVITAYGEAREAGYVGTKAEFENGLVRSAQYAANAQQSATAAAGSASDASQSATQAADSATAADTAKVDAQTAQSAAESAQTAAEAAQEAAEDAAASLDADTIARKDGYYEGLTAGNAEQLLSTVYTYDQVPYKFRASGGSIDIGNRETDMIVGGTIVWNQLCNSASVTILNTHKYYLLKGGTASIGASTGAAITGLTSGTDMVFDLTQMFGSEIADHLYNLEQSTPGAGVAVFKSLFPKDYYEYNPGELLSVEGVRSHDTVGFNQWDEEWEVGGIIEGMDVNNPNRMRSKNYIPILPSTTYYVSVKDYPTWLLIYYFDTDKNYLGFKSESSNQTFTTQQNARYMRFCTSDAWGRDRTYNHDICINLSWSGQHNGEYEEYIKRSYPLDSTLTLRGIPKVDASGNIYYDGDTYESDGTVTRRYGIVDLGTLNWTYDSTYSRFGSSAVSGMSRLYTARTLPMVCSNYVTIADGRSISGIFDKSIYATFVSSGSAQSMVYVHDSSYTDISTFKAAMSGVMLVYELAESTTEQAAPYTNPQIVGDWGTEEYVTDSIVPVGHYTQYPQNLRDKLQHLPNLASADGDYIIRQVNGKMTLVPLTSVLS